MLNWIRNLFPAKKSRRSVSPAHARKVRRKLTRTEPEEQLEIEEQLDSVMTRVELDDGSTISQFDMDQVEVDDKGEMAQALSEAVDIDFVEGSIVHGYSLQLTGSTEQCPQCQSDTKQMYGYFIYASHPTPRIMLAPAGYFCIQCPTVIVDEELLSRGVVGNHPFNGTVGMSPNGEDFEPFETWNGREPIHILDETGNSLGITSIPPDRLRRRGGTKPKRIKSKQSRKNQKKPSKKRRRRK
ncbi:MAG: hypothetical protein AAF702_37190 [Chloroflexota bacterium]